MKKIMLFGIAIVVGILFVTCEQEKDDEKKNVGKVFIVGMDTDEQGYPQATLWIDGQKQYLTNGGGSACAYSIYVTESNDVYVAGRDGNDMILWKNGIKDKTFTNIFGGKNYIYSMYISTTLDVYAAGMIDKKATVWINGIPQDISNGYDVFGLSASSLYVTRAGEWYVAGSAAVNESTAIYWNNGNWNELERITRYHYGISVYVESNDIFVAGSISNGASSEAVLWKNKQLFVRELGSDANSVFVSGNNVYIAGTGRGGYPAILWMIDKETAAAETIPIDGISNATFVYVKENDVHVIGGTGPGSEPRALYWSMSNNEVKLLSDKKSIAVNIFVR